MKSARQSELARVPGLAHLHINTPLVWTECPVVSALGQTFLPNLHKMQKLDEARLMGLFCIFRHNLHPNRPWILASLHNGVIQLALGLSHVYPA